MIKRLIETYQRATDEYYRAEKAFSEAHRAKEAAVKARSVAEDNLCGSLKQGVGVVHGEYVYIRSGSTVVRYKCVSSEQIERVKFLGGEE